MFFDDHKKAITTMMSRRGPKGGAKVMGPASMKPEVVKTEDGEMDGRHAAAQDAMAAMHEKSPAKFMEAMKNFIDIHQSMPQASPEPDMD